MPNDWTGNKNSVRVMLGINSKYNTADRERDDFYSSSPLAMEELLKVEKFNHKVWENACGNGNLVMVLRKYGYDVKATDLIDRGCGVGGVNFLFCNKKWDGDIITNPPYKYALEFVKHSLELINIGNKVAMLFKITFLEGKRRFKELFIDNPPKRIYVFTNRIECAKNNVFTG